MTRQTTKPLQRLPLNTFSRDLIGLVREVDNGTIDLNPPYQRGDVWTTDQRVALVYSWLIGATVPSITFSDRGGRTWTDTDVYDIQGPGGARGYYAVIDGKQRLTTARMWVGGEFAVPASWFDPDSVAVTEDTDDGPYVRHTGLTDNGQHRYTGRIMVPVGIGEFGTMRDEATIYTLLNGGGTPQTSDDMARAQRVAEGK